MMIYRVVFERDGATTRGDGTGARSTEMVRSEHRYAASDIRLAWEAAIHYTLQDPEQRIIAIIEENPLLAVLGQPNESEGKE